MRHPSLPALLLLLGTLPLAARAGEMNLATLSCNRYENEIVGTPQSDPADAPPAAAGPARSAGGAPQSAEPRPDAINLVMWLFGFSVARAGEHHLYADALTSFGFALDAECKDNPNMSLIEATSVVRPNREHPMDLTMLNCGTWESRHADSEQHDPESAKTIMMWLYGFAVGLSGRHMFDPAGVGPFAARLQSECREHPNDSLFDSLTALGRSAAR